MNGATVAAPLARPLVSRRSRELMAGYLYLVPVIVVLAGTVLFPILKAMHMSMYHHVLIKPNEYRFVGWPTTLACSTTTPSAEPQNSLSGCSARVAAVPGGFGAALLLHESFRGRALVRTITPCRDHPRGRGGADLGVHLPAEYGLLNDILNGRLMRSGRRMARARRSPCRRDCDQRLARHAVLRHHAAAGLQAIPTEFAEARVDGAWRSTLRHVTPPLLSHHRGGHRHPIVWTFNYADSSFVMTSGGPVNATQITSTYTCCRRIRTSTSATRPPCRSRSC
jgi:multiple sugar transport system permease protein